MADFEKFGVNLETGILLYGPPGCGKTLIANAVANEAGANFIHIKVDALTTECGNEGGWVVDMFLNQLVIELDGGDQRQGVFLVGATNRTEVMDPALLRPGRFGKLIYVPLPSPDDRGLILKALSKGKPVDPDVDLRAIGRSQACENLSGADLKKLMDEAAMAVLVEASGKNSFDNAPSTIKATHFKRALARISPSTSREACPSLAGPEESLLIFLTLFLFGFVEAANTVLQDLVR